LFGKRGQIKNQIIIISAALRRYSACGLGVTVLKYAGTWRAFHHTGHFMSQGLVL